MAETAIASPSGLRDSQPSAPAAATSSPPADAPPKVTKPSWAIVVLATAAIGVALAVILAAWHIWPFTSAVAVTEDAYVRGQVTSIAPQVNGYVTEVGVRDYQRVRAGQILFRIDDRLYAASVRQAEAQVAQSQATLDNAQQTIAENQATIDQDRASLLSMEAEQNRASIDARRISELSTRGSVSMRDRDTALANAWTADANVAKAQAVIRSGVQTLKGTRVSREGLRAAVEAARAQLATARINLANTIIRAPRDGQVSEASVRAGQYVAAGSQLLYLVPPAAWVVANFKETQLRHMGVGQPAWFTVDSLGGGRVTGHVEQIAPATGSEFSVLRPDNASGNFTKVVQRLPIRIRIDDNQPLASRLRPGMSVIAHVDTSGGTSLEAAR